MAKQEDRPSWGQGFAALPPVVGIPGLIRPTRIAGLVGNLVGMTLCIHVLDPLRGLRPGLAERVDQRPVEVDCRNDIPVADRLHAEGVSGCRIGCLICHGYIVLSWSGAWSSTAGCRRRCRAQRRWPGPRPQARRTIA